MNLSGTTYTTATMQYIVTRQQNSTTQDTHAERSVQIFEICLGET